MHLINKIVTKFATRRLCYIARMAVVFLVLVTTIQPSHTQSEDTFYAGKQISLLIGLGPGGVNDVWARLLSRYITKHIPGRPNVIPQNMPGAGGLKLALHLFGAAPKDGTVFGLINRGIPLEPLFGNRAAQFDPMTMNWIGSPDKDITVCAARKDAEVQTIGDLFTKQLVVGATGSGADTAIYPEFLAELLDMKFKIVKGYSGSNEVLLAMERNEVQGICVAYDSLVRQPMFTTGKINILFQAALEKSPHIPPTVPVGVELAKNAAERQVIELFLSRATLGRPFVAPPGVPDQQVQTLRRAFDATMKDAEFIAEAKKAGLTVDAMTGETLAQTIADIYRTPKDVVNRVSETLGRVSK